MIDRIRQVEERRRLLLNGGAPKDIERQHNAGKLTARERIQKLLDEGSFQETDLWIRALKTGFDIDKQELPADAIITGTGKIRGRPVFVLSQDFTVASGTFGVAFHHKTAWIMEKALEAGLPYVQIIDSGGERIHDWFGRQAHRPVLGGRHPMGNATTMYRAPGIISGVIPQVTLMLGPMYAGAAYVPTMADFMIMRKKTAFMSVASPSLLKSVTFVDVTQEEIGGAELHASKTGIADFLAQTDEEAIEVCRELMTYLPLNYKESTPIINLNDAPDRRDQRLVDIVSPDLSTGYDMHEVIRSIVDGGKFLELQALFARSMIIGFARMNGQTVGIVANNPAEQNGILSIDTCDKQARFIRWCDAFNVPLIFLVDTPGFTSSVAQEQSKDGLIRTAPKPVFAICEATVPKITVHIGRCFGVSRLIMGTLRMGVDFAYSWPSAQFARIDPGEAVDLIYQDEIASAGNPDQVRKDRLAEIHSSHIQYPFHAAEQAMVNDIIDPRDTRPVLIRALEVLANKETAVASLAKT